MIVVADAGPLIALAQVQQIDLLHLLYGELYIPESVYNEVVQAGECSAGSRGDPSSGLGTLNMFKIR
jgi:predicted nucleic acid-binding protein